MPTSAGYAVKLEKSANISATSVNQKSELTETIRSQLNYFQTFKDDQSIRFIHMCMLLNVDTMKPL